MSAETRARQLIERAMTLHPTVQRAYLMDATVHQEIDQLARTLDVVETAMRMEGVPADVAERVLAAGVLVPFEQYDVVEEARTKLVRRLSEVLDAPADVLEVMPSDGIAVVFGNEPL